MTDLRALLSYTELPGPNIHRDFKFPRKADRSEESSKFNKHHKKDQKDARIQPDHESDTQPPRNRERAKSNDKKDTSEDSSTNPTEGILRSRKNEWDANMTPFLKPFNFSKVFGKNSNSSGEETMKKLSESSFRQDNSPRKTPSKCSTHDISDKKMKSPREGNPGQGNGHDLLQSASSSASCGSPRCSEMPSPSQRHSLSTTTNFQTLTPMVRSNAEKRSHTQKSAESSRNFREESHSEKHQTSSKYRSRFEEIGIYSKENNRQTEKAENLLVTLKRFDTLFLIDDSASVGASELWKETAELLRALSQKAMEYDTDGVDVYLLNSSQSLKNAKTLEEIDEFFRSVEPVGESSPLETQLEHLLGRYLDELEEQKAKKAALLKPLNIIVIGDGSTDDHYTLEKVIVNVVQRLEVGNFPRNQVGIQFVQLGKNSEATEALKSLDDEIQSTYRLQRDIVDTISYTGELSENFVIKALLGGINRVRTLSFNPAIFIWLWHWQKK